MSQHNWKKMSAGLYRLDEGNDDIKAVVEEGKESRAWYWVVFDNDEGSQVGGAEETMAEAKVAAEAVVDG